MGLQSEARWLRGALPETNAEPSSLPCKPLSIRFITSHQRPCFPFSYAILLPLLFALTTETEALLLRPSAMQLLQSVNAPLGVSREDATQELDKRMLGLAQSSTLSRPHLQGIKYRHHLSINVSSSTRAASKADFGNYDVLPETGANFKDVKEGELGTCYFLAVLIALARTHPHFIENMFIERDLWLNSPPIFTTKWHLDGVTRNVVVNSEIPTDPETVKPYFTKPNEGASFWPVILEKAWAKIFGAYRNVVGGHMAEVFQAITSAPCYKIDHREKNLAWLEAMLEKAFEFHWSVGAASKENKVGIPSGHAYIVFGICDVPGFGKSVTMYNPWARDVYAGVIPNPDKTDGMFNMTWDEYVSSYDHTSIAFVMSGYQTSAAVLDSPDPNETIMNAAMIIETTTDMPFAVSLVWPNDRFLPGCASLAPLYTVAAAPLDNPTAMVYAHKSSPTMSTAMARLNVERQGGPRKWLLFLYAEFPRAKWLEYVAVNVYAAEKVRFRIGHYEQGEKQSNYTTMAHTAFLEMSDLCDVIEIAGRGNFERRDDFLVNGMPSYHALDLSRAGKHIIMFWHSERMETDDEGYAVTHGDDTWKVTDTLEHAIHGLYFDGFDKDRDAKCVDSPYRWVESVDFRGSFVYELEEADEVAKKEKKSHGKNTNLLQAQTYNEKTALALWNASLLQSVAGDFQTKEQERKHRRTVFHRAAQRRTLSNVFPESEVSRLIQLQTKNPSDDSDDRANDYHCGMLLRRLESLNNADQIKASGRDEYFPAAQASIGAPDDTCCDSASQDVIPCSAYNHWDTFENIVKTVWSHNLAANMTLEMQQKCIARTPPQQGDEACQIQNLCDSSQVLFCAVFDVSTGKDEYKMLGPLSPHFDGTGPLEFCQCEMRVQSDMSHVASSR